MGPDAIWILIPLAGMSIPILAIWSKHKQQIAAMQVDAVAAKTAEKAAQYASQIKALEDRVRVLERIVTDSGYNTASQIDALRDTQRVEDAGRGVPLGREQERV